MCLLCLLKFFGKDNKYKHPDRCRACPTALMQVCVCRQCVCVGFLRCVPLCIKRGRRRGGWVFSDNNPPLDPLRWCGRGTVRRPFNTLSDPPKPPLPHPTF